MAQRREDMRAADSDRQFVAEQLQKALNEGRLSLGEYDDRLQQAYAARTYGELDGLLQDLPTVIPAERAQMATTPPAADPTVVVPGASRRRAMPGWLVATWGSWLSSSLVCTVIWLATDPGGYPWPIWVAGPWGAVLLCRTVMGFVSGDPAAYHQAELDRQRGRQRDKLDRHQQRHQDRWDRRHRQWERGEGR